MIASLVLSMLVACGPKKAPESAASAGASEGAEATAARSKYGVTMDPNVKAEKGVLGDVTDEEVIAWINRPFAAASYRFAEESGADTKVVDRVRDVLQLVFQGDLQGAEQAAGFFAKDFPASGMAEASRVVIASARASADPTPAAWDAVRSAVTTAQGALTAAIAKPGNEALEELALAGVFALGAKADAEEGRWADAKTRADKAEAHLARVRTLAPKLPDTAVVEAGLAWWMSQGGAAGVATSTPKTPSEALGALRAAERNAHLLGPAATLALARGQLAGGDARSARDRGLRFRVVNPDNTVNNLILAQAFVGARQPGDALAVLDEVVAKQPDNLQAQLWRGVALMRAGKLDAAEDALSALSTRAGVPATVKGAALTKLARVELKQGHAKKAQELLEQAIATSDDPEATQLLARVREGKGDGE